MLTGRSKRYHNKPMLSLNKTNLLVFIIVLLKSILCSTEDITVSTYNLWNVMFNWDIRKYRIAELIREAESDVVAFQEVRMDFPEEHSQIAELKKLLPEFKWNVWRSANRVDGQEKYVKKLWMKEGIGFLSRKPILDISIQNLPQVQGPDKNRRIALHASVDFGQNLVVNFIAVHFSYDRQQQCHNAAALLEYVRLKRMKNTIILGDFNTYEDFDASIRVFTDRVLSPSNPCSPHISTQSKTARHLLVDTWKVSAQHGSGLTFSNMPTPGYESRPDRILVSKSAFTVKTAALSGNGTKYKKRYKASIKFKRVRSLIKSAYYSALGYIGFSCDHDCGPRGVCRCGVCARGDHSKCNLPNCPECDGRFFMTFVTYSSILSLLIIAFLCSLLKVLIVSAKFNPETFFSILGCTCCLFNPQLYSFQRLSSRHRCLRIFLPIARLPPMVLLFLTLILIVFILFIGENFFQRGLEIASLIMDEEFFPSDHLMYTVKLEYNA